MNNERLSLEETESCLKLWREEKDRVALNKIAESNFGLVVNFALKYSSMGFDIDTLVSAGGLGLTNAINKFDYKNYDVQAFSTYVSEAIINSIRNEMRICSNHKNVLSFEQPLYVGKDGEEFRVEDIIGTDDDEIVDNIITDMKREIVRDALRSLNSRERKIILLRYGFDEEERMTRKELGEMFGCSSSTVANQEKHALVKMRHPRNTRKLKDFAD